MTQHKGIELYNITVKCGSIVVSFFAVASTPRLLQAFVDAITTSNDTLTFTYKTQLLEPSSVFQDPNYPIDFGPESSEDELLLILATTIPSGSILLATILLVLVVSMCQKHKKKNKVFKINVKPVTVNPAAEGRYIEHRAIHFPRQYENQSIDSFHLLPDNKVSKPESQSVEEYEMEEVASIPSKDEIVVSTEIKVLGTTSEGLVLTNPVASSDVGSLDELQDSLEEIFTRSNDNTNNNNSAQY